MYSADCEVISDIIVPTIRFEKIEVDTQSASVISCSISCPDEKTIIAQLRMKGATIEEIESSALSVTKLILFRLEGNFGLLTGILKCTVRNAKDESGRKINIMRGTVMLPDPTRPRVAAEKTAGELKPIIEGPASARDTYLELYHHARSATNPTIRFLSYYQIIASLLGDPHQHVIDKFFADNDPSMPPSTQHPTRDKRNETVYTRLRNEVAHVRTRTGSNLPKDPLHVHAEIERFCHRLSQLAYSAITQLT
jgi:hypothetical protein